MDFIERWFHVSPDGGAGTLELFCFAIALVIVMVFTITRVFKISHQNLPPHRT